MTPRNPILGLALLTCMLGATVGCARLLDIEQASCDETFDPKCDGNNTVADDDPSSSGGMPNAGEDAATDSGPAISEHELSCRNYCDALEENCGTPQLRQYPEKGCVRLCMDYLPFGTDSESNGDSLECRLPFALNASAETDTACLAAGLTGGDECGTRCEVYCRLMKFKCTAQFDSVLGGTLSTCVERCAAVPPAPRFNVSVVKGDTLDCRFYHLQAANLQPDVHCPHTAGEEPCR